MHGSAGQSYVDTITSRVEENTGCALLPFFTIYTRIYTYAAVIVRKMRNIIINKPTNKRVLKSNYYASLVRTVAMKI